MADIEQKTESVETTEKVVEKKVDAADVTDKAEVKENGTTTEEKVAEAEDKEEKTKETNGDSKKVEEDVCTIKRKSTSDVTDAAAVVKDAVEVTPEKKAKLDLDDAVAEKAEENGKATAEVQA